MWQITSIKAEKFLSHKNLNYEIVNNSLTMVYGINNDLNVKRSNGSGKSVLLDSITFAITGDCLRKIKTIKELIANNEESCLAEIELFNPVLNYKMRIRRNLHLKKSQKVTIWINEELQSQLLDLKPLESDKFIADKLGISFEDLLNYYLISKFSYQSLFLAGDTAKKQVINRFSKADIVDDVFPIVDKDIKEDQDKINQLDKNLIESSTKIGLYEDQIEELLNEDADEKKAEKITIIQLKIDAEDDKIFDCEEAIKKFEESTLELEDKIKTYKKAFIKETEIVALQNNIDLLNESFKTKQKEYLSIRLKYKDNFEDLNKKVAHNKDEILKYENEVKSFHKEISELEKYIAGEIECPKCKHHFILTDSDFNVEDAKKEIKLFNEEKEKSQKFLNECLFEKNGIREGIDELEKVIFEEEKSAVVENNKLKKEILDLEQIRTEKIRENTKIQGLIDNCSANVKKNAQEIQFKHKTIDNIEENIKSFQTQILNVKEENNIDAIKTIQDKIDLEEGKMKDIVAKTDSLKLTLTEKQEWILKFKKFKNFLANSALETIESQANFYLEKMKIELMISIDGFRELSNGKFNEEINIQLSRDGGIFNENFQKFSGGEKSLSDLCSILAMQSIINTTSNSGGLNFLMCDEVTESIDQEGMNNVIECLNKLNQTIMIIAHSQASESIDCNKLIIEKKNGISSLLLN